VSKRDDIAGGLPKARKRPHAFGSPTADQFYEAVAKARRLAAARRKGGKL
jgi:hypothetical protein